jgi:SAM-dependent methyltransferase
MHAVALAGFGQNASDYEQARPSYPPDAVTFLVDNLALGPGRITFDVGAGTGKLTRLLAAAGAEVVAVEPVAAMRTELRASTPSALVCAAMAEALPVRSGRADAVVCAQAFHWFATDAVVAEFARVLRPGGRLALVWNVRDNSVPWVRSFTELLRPYEGDRPDHNGGDWRAVFSARSPLGPLETTTFRHDQPMTPDLLVARAASMSFVGAMDPAARDEVLSRVRDLGRSVGESFSLPYRTEVHLTAPR